MDSVLGLFIFGGLAICAALKRIVYPSTLFEKLFHHFLCEKSRILLIQEGLSILKLPSLRLQKYFQ
jgi:hypothetical protein